MAINFPTSLDNFTNHTDGTTVLTAALLNEIREATNALEAKVGIDDSAVTTSHDYMLANQKVNIYTADAARLTTLKGVGPRLAQRITEFRKENGPFQKAEDIMQVKGVGTKVFDQNKDRIVLK